MPEKLKAPPLVGYFVPLRAFCLGCGGMVAFEVLPPGLNVGKLGVGQFQCPDESCRYHGFVFTVDLQNGQVLAQSPVPRGTIAVDLPAGEYRRGQEIDLKDVRVNLNEPAAPRDPREGP